MRRLMAARKLHWRPKQAVQHPTANRENVGSNPTPAATILDIIRVTGGFRVARFRLGNLVVPTGFRQ